MTFYICDLCAGPIKYHDDGSYAEAALVYQVVDGEIHFCRDEMLKGAALRQVHERCLRCFGPLGERCVPSFFLSSAERLARRPASNKA